MDKHPMYVNAHGILKSVDDTSDSVDVAKNLDKVIIKNLGDNPVFVSSDTGSITVAYPTDGTATRGTIIQAGQVETYSKDPAHNKIGVICASGLTSTVYINWGDGN